MRLPFWPKANVFKQGYKRRPPGSVDQFKFYFSKGCKYFKLKCENSNNAMRTGKIDFNPDYSLLAYLNFATSIEVCHLRSTEYSRQNFGWKDKDVLFYEHYVGRSLSLLYLLLDVKGDPLRLSGYIADVTKQSVETGVYARMELARIAEIGDGNQEEFEKLSPETLLHFFYAQCQKDLVIAEDLDNRKYRYSPERQIFYEAIGEYKEQIHYLKSTVAVLIKGRGTVSKNMSNKSKNT